MNHLKFGNLQAIQYEKRNETCEESIRNDWQARVSENKNEHRRYIDTISCSEALVSIQLNQSGEKEKV